MIPEQNIYREDEASAITEYLEENRGETLGTADIRMSSTAGGGLSATEEVYEVLEELEKGSFLEKKEGATQDSWRVNSFYHEQDAFDYLTEGDAKGRRPHPLGSEFDKVEVKKATTLEQLLTS